MTRRHVFTPSGRCHIAGAINSCDVRRVTFSGLCSVVKSDAAVDSNLQSDSVYHEISQKARHEADLGVSCWSV
jgi:hypothetical protein